MNGKSNSMLKMLFLPAAGALILTAGLLSFPTSAVRAQSVEKAETTQDAKKQEDEVAIARAAVTKPGEKREKLETGHLMDGYSVQSTLELGYRWVGVGGNADSYRSQINVREGLRVLEYSLDSRRLEGTGSLYDSLKLNINNMGGDSSQTYALGIEKSKFYRFDANIRRFNYFRLAGPNYAFGWRDFDTRNQVSDYNLRLFPQRAVRITLGFDQTMATGRYTQPFSFQRDLFPVLGRTRWIANDYKIGMDAHYGQWTLNGGAFVRRFKNDPLLNYTGSDLLPGFNATDNAKLGYLDREFPLRSRSVVTHFGAQGNLSDRLHLMFRILHNDETMNMNNYYENAGGTSSTANQLIISAIFTANGVANRTTNEVNAGATYDVSKHISVNDTFRFSSYRIDGNNFTSSVTTSKTGTNNPVVGAASTTQAQNYLTDYKSYWNTLDVDINMGRKFLANLGWRVMNRDVAVKGTYLVPSSTTTAPSITDDSESATTHAFVGGFRWRPVNKASLIFDVERGESNTAFVRINPLEYTRFRVRAQYQINDKLNIAGTIATVNRTNPTPVVQNDSNSRSYGGSLNWDPNQRFWLNLGYDYNSFYSNADLRYTVSGVTYFSRLVAYGRVGSAYFNSRVAVTNKLDLLLMYNYCRDRGAPGGVVLPVSSVPLVTGDNVMALPFAKHNPEGRLAYRFNNNVTGNISYRHYRYSENNLPKRLNADNLTFTLLDPGYMDYHAGIVTLSVKITF